MEGDLSIVAWLLLFLLSLFLLPFLLNLPYFSFLLPSATNIYTPDPSNTRKHIKTLDIRQNIEEMEGDLSIVAWLLLFLLSLFLLPFLLNLPYFSFLLPSATNIYTPDPSNTRKHVEITRY